MKRLKHPQNKHERRLVERLKSKNRKGGSKMSDNLVVQTQISQKLITQLMEQFLVANGTIPHDAKISMFKIDGLTTDLVPISIVYKKQIPTEEGDQNSPN